jgi:hypothetical protein
VDKILDTAGQKGTGKWTVINSADLGIPITLIAEAVYARCVSALKEERVTASQQLAGPQACHQGRPREIYRADPPSAVRLEDCLIRPGVHADARGRQEIWLEIKLRRHRLDVARWLYHPEPFPR